jgi:putative transposase
MLIYEYKLDGSKTQYTAIDDAIRIVQFIRNTCLRLWMDEHASKNDLQKYCAVLAKEFPFANHLNSQARQASADRAGFAISLTIARRRNQGRKGTHVFKKTIARWNTNIQGGSLNQMDATSPSRTDAISVVSVW